MFIIVETTENGQRLVTALPQKWIVGGILYWPQSKTISIAKQCAKEIDPIINEWKGFKDFKILQNNISSYDEARNREIYYSKYNNTDSEVEDLKIRNIQRGHPVNFASGETGVDLNKMYDDKNTKILQIDLDINKTPNVECPKNISPESPKQNFNCIEKKSKKKNPSSTRTDEFENPPKIASNDPTFSLIELNNNKLNNSEEIKGQSEYKVSKINKNELKRKQQQPASIANEQFHESENDFSKIKKRKMEKNDRQKQKFPEKTTEIKKNEKTAMLVSLKSKIRAQSEKIENMTAELEKLKTGISVLTELMQSFCANMTKAPKTVKEDPLFQMPGLPLRNIPDIKRFNNLLLGEDYLQQVAVRLTKMLSTTMSLNKMVKICVEKIMCYYMLLSHSWSGKSGISANAPRSKLSFNEYGCIIALIKLTINNVKEVLDENLKKSLVEILKRSSQNKIREDLKLIKKREIQPATSTSFNAAEDSTETETDNSSDADEL